MPRPDEHVTVYVIWRCDEDDFFVTSLDLEAMFVSSEWKPVGMSATQALTEMAHDAEYPNGPNRVANGDSYETIAIFTGEGIRFLDD